MGLQYAAASACNACMDAREQLAVMRARPPAYLRLFRDDCRSSADVTITSVTNIFEKKFDETPPFLLWLKEQLCILTWSQPSRGARSKGSKPKRGAR